MDIPLVLLLVFVAAAIVADHLLWRPPADPESDSKPSDLSPSESHPGADAVPPGGAPSFDRSDDSADELERFSPFDGLDDYGISYGDGIGVDIKNSAFDDSVVYVDFDSHVSPFDDSPSLDPGGWSSYGDDDSLSID